MKEITSDALKDIEYTWLNSNFNFVNNKGLFAHIGDIPEGARIVKATIDSLGIAAYLPIATRYHSAHNYIEGCRTITYDITGKKPIYYKFKTVLNSSMAPA
jgi:hypothetical protein